MGAPGRRDRPRAPDRRARASVGKTCLEDQSHPELKQGSRPGSALRRPKGSHVYPRGISCRKRSRRRPVNRERDWDGGGAGTGMARRSFRREGSGPRRRRALLRLADDYWEALAPAGASPARPRTRSSCRWHGPAASRADTDGCCREQDEGPCRAQPRSPRTRRRAARRPGRGCPGRRAGAPVRCAASSSSDSTPVSAPRRDEPRRLSRDDGVHRPAPRETGARHGRTAEALRASPCAQTRRSSIAALRPVPVSKAGRSAWSESMSRPSCEALTSDSSERSRPPPRPATGQRLGRRLGIMPSSRWIASRWTAERRPPDARGVHPGSPAGLTDAVGADERPWQLHAGWSRHQPSTVLTAAGIHRTMTSCTAPFMPGGAA